MKRLMLAAAAASSLLTLSGDAQAQADERVEIMAGIRYPLVSQRFEIEQSSGSTLAVAFRVSSGFYLGGRYETFSTEDGLERGGDVELDLYGLTASFDLNDDPDVRLLGTVSAGQGELTWENPGPPDPLLADGTDIDLWYEAGVAVEFHAGRRWLFRLGLAARQVRPETPSVLLRSTRAVIVPSLDIGIRF